MLCCETSLCKSTLRAANIGTSVISLWVLPYLHCTRYCIRYNMKHDSQLITIQVNVSAFPGTPGSQHYRWFGGCALDVSNLPPFVVMTGRGTQHGCCIMSRSSPIDPHPRSIQVAANVPLRGIECENSTLS